MVPIRAPEWRKLPLSLTELCIETTLRCGQSFRWRKVGDEWNCVLHGRLLSLTQDPESVKYKVTWPDKANTGLGDDTEALLRHYFSLKYDLGALYKQWSADDANFRKKAPQFTGIRILSQDAWEALVSFICSSNNNISRICQMVDKLCKNYGPFVAKVGDEAFHDFPTPAALSGDKVESHLRELGFGYRAKYIADTARIITNTKPVGWLDSLANPENPGWGVPPHQKTVDGEVPTYKHAHEELLTLSGVGPKVSDCVCLMGLGWAESVPVDTHVWQIAQRDYKFGGKSKTKTFSKVLYDAVGDHFRAIWGPQAGWAQSVLFTANLKSFSEQLAAKPSAEVVAFKVEVEEKATVPEVLGRTRSRKVIISEDITIKREADSQVDNGAKKRRRTRT
ncbi:DNA glycosylase [Microdochium trichocladiopsis]|uniref:DNA-(apurinic or apyrimidinic site) lyase n=1 Tax=Microdochium trichocladiopsis TaxID=1682393 RepID=A0A9P8YBR4_9PEZI|nr:DNA glycosylase [Microdochium trichocladiopsis]KAH7034970.1 DNA glycosylase [Microdochium trichocladiopsis]